MDFGFMETSAAMASSESTISGLESLVYAMFLRIESNLSAQLFSLSVVLRW